MEKPRNNLYQNSPRPKSAFSFSTIAFIGTFFLGVIWEIVIFGKFPKTGWIDGLLSAWFSSQGLLVYRDFVASNTPILRMAMLPFHQVFGFSQSPTIFLSLVNSLTTLFLLFFASAKILTGWSRAVPLVFFLLWDPFLGANAFNVNPFLGTIVLTMVILWWVWYQNHSSTIALFLGLLGGVAVMTLQMLAPLALLMLVFFLLWRRYRSLLAASVGFLLPITWVSLWFVQRGAFEDFYYWTVKFYLTIYPFTDWGKGTETTIVFFAIHSPILLIGAAMLLAWKRKSWSIARELLLLSVVLASLPVTFWFAVFHPTRFQISLPAFAFAFGLGIHALRIGTSAFTRWSLIGITIALTVVSAKHYVVPLYQKQLSYEGGGKVVTKLYGDDPMYDAVEWVENNTPKDAKIFTIADALFYFEAKRLPASPRATSNIPTAYEPLSDFAQELIAKPPDYWVVDERIWSRYKDFGKEYVTSFLKKMLACEPVVAQLDYYTIRKHQPEAGLCI